MKVAIEVGTDALSCKLFESLSDCLVGHEVILVSPTTERALVDVVEALKPSICIGISFGSGNGITSGTETFYTTGAAGGSAQRIHEAVLEVLGIRDRGVTALEASSYIPIVRTQLGYSDSMVDMVVVASNLRELAKAIVSAI